MPSKSNCSPFFCDKRQPLRQWGRVVLFALALCLFFGTPNARADEASHKEDLAINSVIRDLGMFEVVRDIPQMLADGLAQQKREKPATDAELARRDRLARMLDAQFVEREIIARARTFLAKSYDESRYSTLQRLLQSPIARNLMQLKRDAMSDSSLTAIRRLAADYKESEQDKGRLAILRQLDDASGDTEFFVAAQALAIYSLTLLTDPDVDPKLNSDTFLRQTYDQLIRPSRFTTTMTYLYAFRSQSNADLQQFVDLYSFADVQWFLSAFMDSLRDAVFEFTKDTARRTPPASH